MSKSNKYALITGCDGLIGSEQKFSNKVQDYRNRQQLERSFWGRSFSFGKENN